MRSTIPLSRRGAAVLGLLVLTACSTAEAAPPPVPPPVERHGALVILDRLADREGALPDAVGMTVGTATAALRAVGATPQVVALSDDDVVSAQYPPAGADLPADGQVIVWLGTPPAPPPPPPPAEPEAVVAPSSQTLTAAAVPPAPAAAPAATVLAPVDDTTFTGPGPGATPGLVVPEGPAPPRSNIRTMAPAEPGLVLEGPASWYGPGFEGRTTACGGVFDSSQLTLASRELRCGTTVRVTGPSGASVEAVVTDWGPAEWTNRRFDLSAATFAAVHHPGAGVVSVRVEVLGH